MLFNIVRSIAKPQLIELLFDIGQIKVTSRDIEIDIHTNTPATQPNSSIVKRY